MDNLLNNLVKKLLVEGSAEFSKDGLNIKAFYDNGCLNIKTTFKSPKEDDKTADSSLRDFWSNEATLIQKGLIYAISPSVYRAITADNDYIRSDIAEEILHKVKHYVFDPSDYDFAGLHAVTPWRIANVLRDKYMYFWDLCATGNNELIRKTYGAEEILEMLKTAEKESIC